MAVVHTAVRRRAFVACLVMAFAVSLAAPAIALAANATSFTSRVPAPGGTTASARPAISVSVYDADGIRRATSVAMTLDGTTVRPSVTYNKKGDYRRLRVVFSPPADLGPGSHAVKVTVRDAKGRVASSSWKFTVAISASPTFSSESPLAAGATSLARPAISIDVAAAAGVSGAGACSMLLDGTAVTPILRYATAGSDKALSLSFAPGRALAVGEHTVRVTVTDRLGRASVRSWAFTITASESMPDSSASAGCGGCHGGYPATHPMTACEKCHGAASPARPPLGLAPGDPMAEYTPADVSAHTLGCSLEPVCHGGEGNAFPHLLDSDCARCHDRGVAGIPSGHAGPAEAAHDATASAGCLGSACHVGSLTKEHYRRMVGGDRLSCTTCHASDRAAVVAAIDAGDTACVACHAFEGGVHPGTAAVHAVTVSCATAGCHPADATAIHRGTCSACHADGRTPSLVCSTCHASGSYHEGIPTAHAAPQGACVKSGCHGSAALEVHNNVCSRCHAAGRTLTLDCASCHEAAAVHADGTAPHGASLVTCQTGTCHDNGVTAVHQGVGCRVCHATSAQPAPTARCTACHAADPRTYHAPAAASHEATGVTCTEGACHDTDVTVIHDDVCSRCHAQGQDASVACVDCHATDSFHSGAPAAHAAPSGGCIIAACHVSDVTSIHKQQCIRCHAQGKTLSLACTSCHASGAFHTDASAAHTTGGVGCVVAGCHSTNVTIVHKNVCSRCHAEGKTPSVVCSECHADTAIHAGAPTAHTAPAESCVVAACHVSDVTAIHKGTCSRCHAEGKTPSLVCSSCHASGAYHLDAPGAHSASDTTACAKSGCHAADVTAIHKGTCSRCHAEGRMLTRACSSCHGDGSFHTRATASHTPVPAPSCVSALCHASEVTVIHKGTCSRCHTGSAPSIACATCHVSGSFHATATVSHVAPSEGCVGSRCHRTDVSAIHTACTRCHVTGRTPSVACATCHSTATVHSDKTAVHTASTGACVNSACHVQNVLTIHADHGCVPCHNETRAPSVTCSQCHAGTVTTVHDLTAAHAAPAISCAEKGCHDGDVQVTHADVTTGCGTCHQAGQVATKTCTTCHGEVRHVVDPVKHSLGKPCANSSCHSTDVRVIHAEPGCFACHAKDKTPSTDCAGCHVGFVHPDL